MLLGYNVYFHGNKYEMLENVALEEGDKYRDTYSINKFNPDIKIRIKKPVFCTCDCFKIVSDEFKLFCEREAYEGLEFVVLPKSPGFYWFKAHKVIEFDPMDAGVRYLNYSEQYQGYEEIVGADPVNLKVLEPIPDGFFRSDLCFGWAETKHPLLFMGVETMKKIKAAGFKYFYVEEIKDNYK